MPLSYSFAGKVVFVADGSSEIGRQLVQRFLDKRAVVFTTCRDLKQLQYFTKQLPNVTVYLADLTNSTSLKYVVKCCGKIDHFVNNVEFCNQKNFKDVTERRITRPYSVPAHAATNLSQIVANAMIKLGQGGTIITISPQKNELNGISTVLAKSELAVFIQVYRITAVNSFLDVVEIPFSKYLLDGSNFPSQMYQGKGTQQFITTDEVADLIMFLLVG